MAIYLRSAGRALVAALAAGVATELVNFAYIRLMMARQIRAQQTSGAMAGIGAVSLLDVTPVVVVAMFLVVFALSVRHSRRKA